MWPLTNVGLLLPRIIFLPPFLIDFVVIVLVCFYLVNMDRRFRMLNSVWQWLPAGLVAVPGGRTYSEITVLVENVRLLHAELCELLRMFSLGFGQVLLGYIAMSYINMVFQYFMLMTVARIPPPSNPNEIKIRHNLLYVMNVQHIMFFVFIIVAASRTIERVRAAQLTIC